MDAIQLIEKHIDVEKILDHYKFDSVRPSGNFVRACCGIHGGDNPMSFVINQENGLWSCHTNCGNGNIFQMVQKIEEISFPQAVGRVAEILGIDITKLAIVARNDDEKRELKEWKKTILALQPKAFEEYVPIGDAKVVKKFKDFLPETIEFFGLYLFEELHALSRDGNPFLVQNRIGFPIKRDGKTIGMSLRAIRSHQLPKWLHQPSTIKTSELLYNFDEAIGKEEVAVVEGITDVWAYHEIGVTAVATYGAHLGDEQRRLLIQLGCDIVLSYDGDKAGRDATKRAIEALGRTSNVKVVHLPDGKDPENLKRTELRDTYEKRNNYKV